MSLINKTAEICASVSFEMRKLIEIGINAPDPRMLPEILQLAHLTIHMEFVGGYRYQDREIKLMAMQELFEAFMITHAEITQQITSGTFDNECRQYFGEGH